FHTQFNPQPVHACQCQIPQKSFGNRSNDEQDQRKRPRLHETEQSGIDIAGSFVKMRTGTWIERSKSQQTLYSRSTYGNVTFPSRLLFWFSLSEDLCALCKSFFSPGFPGLANPASLRIFPFTDPTFGSPKRQDYNSGSCVTACRKRVLRPHYTLGAPLQQWGLRPSHARS